LFYSWISCKEVESVDILSVQSGTAMDICKKCGTSNESGSVFCAACGFQLSNQTSAPDQPGFLKRSEFITKKEEYQSSEIPAKIQKTKLFHNEKYKQPDFPFIKYLVIVIGGFSVILGFSSLLDDYPSLPSMPSMPSMPTMPPLTGSIVVPLGLTILASVILFLSARDSTRDPVLFWIIEVLILTFGLSVLIPGASSILIPIGMTLAGLLCVFLFARRTDHHSALFGGLYIVVLMFGLVILIPGSANIIFPLGLILVGISLCFWGLRIKTNQIPTSM
jgi:hypothetical protein